MQRVQDGAIGDFVAIYATRMSTMMGIMGRMSAYTGKEVTWDCAMESKLATMPEKLSWDMKLPEPKPAEPGKTPLV